MLTYQEYEHKVYEWLKSKHDQEPSFAFSLRQKANKGAERDYFIGTAKSRYFGTTFWNIPVNFPGSSTDLIDIFFHITESGYSYSFEFQQTTNPEDEQNQYALKLIQELKPIIEKAFPQRLRPNKGKAMEKILITSQVNEYKDIDKMLLDVQEDIEKILPIVDEKINEMKRLYSDFEARRFTQKDFINFQDKLNKRLQRNRVIVTIDLLQDYSPSVQQPLVNRPVFPLNQILCGPPGTGKTYTTITKALEILGHDTEEKRDILKERYDSYVQSGEIVFTTFHQSMSYEDFVEGIKPDTNEAGAIIYDIEPGIFKRIADLARNNWLASKQEEQKLLSFDEAIDVLKAEWEDNPTTKFPLKREHKDFIILGFTKSSIRFEKSNGSKLHTLSISTLRDYYYGKEVKPQGVGVYYPAILDKLKSYQSQMVLSTEEKNYVLIIDEINRGNVSQIFGELITLIEEDKRLGEDEALEVTLPYSKEQFGVPSNLYIIGTMNTADRSVEALDAALRRRFSFEEMPPRPELLAEKTIAEINLQEILTVINSRIEKLLDKDHLIGHSYFLNVEDIQGVKRVFQNNIIPLLQEYFFGDYGKLGLILGQGFVKQKKETDNSVFAKFEEYDAADFADRPVYQVNNAATMTDEEFVAAVNTLLRKPNAA